VITIARLNVRSQSAVAVMTALRPNRLAFTLIELLVVVAVIGILASLLLPALSVAKEKAKVAKVHAELYGVGLALEMYADDHEGGLPPVRVNCNSDLSSHWCQFPIELAAEGYLPRGDQPGLAARMEDVFNRGHTYKYAAPGPQILNESAGGNYRLWIPDDFPLCATNSGKYYSTRADSPVRWVVWSLGPKPDSTKTHDDHAPLAGASWYRHARDGGVIARMATREGMQLKTP
jgi:prepilin-type N-terminal cleavage/methylation domain-containing protein